MELSYQGNVIPNPLGRGIQLFLLDLSLDGASPNLLGSLMPMQEHTKRMPKKMLAFFLAELKLQTRSVNHGRNIDASLRSG